MPRLSANLLDESRLPLSSTLSPSLGIRHASATWQSTGLAMFHVELFVLGIWARAWKGCTLALVKDIRHGHLWYMKGIPGGLVSSSPAEVIAIIQEWDEWITNDPCTVSMEEAKAKDVKPQPIDTSIMIPFADHKIFPWGIYQHQAQIESIFEHGLTAWQVPSVHWSSSVTTSIYPPATFSSSQTPGTPIHGRNCAPACRIETRDLALMDIILLEAPTGHVC